MSNLGKNGSDHSLCWDCANSTKPHICSWTKNFTPVKGWVAKPTKIGGSYPMDSYKVVDCPLFKRDSFNGGTDAYVFQKHEPVKLQNSEVKDIACAIIERYAEDWKMLEHGKIKDLVIGGAHIYRFNVLRFFASQWFGDLFVIALPELEPPDIWEALKIPKWMLKEVMDGE